MKLKKSFFTSSVHKQVGLSQAGAEVFGYQAWRRGNMKGERTRTKARAQDPAFSHREAAWPAAARNKQKVRVFLMMLVPGRYLPLSTLGADRPKS